MFSDDFLLVFDAYNVRRVAIKIFFLVKIIQYPTCFCITFCYSIY